MCNPDGRAMILTEGIFSARVTGTRRYNQSFLEPDASTSSDSTCGARRMCFCRATHPAGVSSSNFPGFVATQHRWGDCQRDCRPVRPAINRIFHPRVASVSSDPPIIDDDHVDDRFRMQHESGAPAGCE